MPNDTAGTPTATAAERPGAILDKAKKFTEAFGPVLIPIVLLWLGQRYTAQQARLENERADFDRMNLILDRFASDNPKQRMEAVHVLNFFVEKCEFTSIFVPALQQGLNDPDPNVVKAARGVLGYGIRACSKVKDAVQQAAEANPETSVSVYKAADSNPAIAKTLDLRKLPSLVYIQIKDENQRQIAEKIQQELIAQGYLAPGIEKVEPGNMPSQTEIRYFHPEEEDRKGAEALAALMAKVNLSAQLKLVRGYEKTARLNQYELWLASP